MQPAFSENHVAIRVTNVYKSFKTVQAVRGVSLTIPHGEFVGLLGPNGAGKTTLVEMIEGIQKPDSGEILIDGKQWHGHRKELHQIIGISLQETKFIDKLTVKETLSLFASFYELTSRRVDEILELTGLSEKSKAYVVNLSGGQRQRLALGLALLNEPRILLLDEPTTGLDPNARQSIWNILLTLREKRKTSLILTTHYMEEAEFLCDYIILIDQGKILRQGTLPQLLTGKEKAIEFTLENTLNKLAELPTVHYLNIYWDPQQAKGTLMVKDLDQELPLFLDYLRNHQLKLTNLECRQQTLNDLFISLTGRRIEDEVEK